MAVIISVVNGGAAIGAQRIGPTKNGVSHIKAVDGARYVFADVQGGGAPAGVSVKRAGKNLVVVHDLDDVEQGQLVIEDFYGSGAQLVSQGAGGDYSALVAQLDDGAIAVADLGDGASSLLTVGSIGTPSVSPSFPLSETGPSSTRWVGAGMAALAGGGAMSSDDCSKSAPAQLAREAALEDGTTAEVLVEPAPGSAAERILTGSGQQLPTISRMPESVVSLEGSAVRVQQELVGADTADQLHPVVADTNDVIATDGRSAVRSVEDTPVIEAVLDDQGLIHGIVENGGYTDDGRPQIVGKAEPGVLVHIYRGVELIGQVVAGAAGEWSFTPKFPLSDGRHVITVVHEYPDGDVSDVSDPYVIFVDKSVPDAPVIIGMQDDEGRITGSIAEGMITDDDRPTIDGTAEAHATIIVYDKGKEIGRTLAGADGTWRFVPEPALADGYHQLSYAAMDRAGNGSERSAVSEFVVDTRPEKINIYYADDDVGNITGEVFSGGVTDDTMPALFGTATAGGIVKIYEGDVLLGQVTAGVDGTWTFIPPMALSEGLHSFQATVTLVAKGESDRSRPFTLEVDTAAPEGPSIERILDDVGSIQGFIKDGDTTDDAMPTLSGKAEAGSTVRIIDNGILLGTAVADGDGSWSYTPSATLADGVHSFTVIANDKAGNETAWTGEFAIVIDTKPPTVPSILSVLDDVGPVQGLLQTGATTDDATPTLSGEAEANSMVIVRNHGAEIGRAKANAEGEWTFTPGVPLSSGTYRITVAALDEAGNASVESNAFEFTVSFEQPIAPSIVSVYDDVGPFRGLLSSGAATDDRMPMINGTANPNQNIVIKDNGVEIGRVVANGQGNWSFMPPTALGLGLHNLIAGAVDMNGNIGESSAIFGLRVVELGSDGAAVMENFNTLAEEDVNSAHTYGLVLPSGVVLTGTFGVDGFGRLNTATSARPEDQDNGLVVYNNNTMKIQLPCESDKVTFHQASYMSSTTVVFFDAAGKKIGQKVYPGNSNGSYFTREVFEAPAGTKIASMEVKAGAYSVQIDALQWADRYLTGVSISAVEADGFGGRVVYGKVSGVAHLKASEELQVSTDGGLTWTKAVFSEGSWVAIQKNMPRGSWVAEVRVIDKSTGLELGLTDTRAFDGVAAAAPLIVRIENAEGVYTSTEAQQGSLIEVSLAGTGAKFGDAVHVCWGKTTYDYILTKSDIAMGHASIQVPWEQTWWQGAGSDFSVKAQIIGPNGAIGALSEAYDVVTRYYLTPEISDGLQKVPKNNAYQGDGFKISVDGLLEKTAKSGSTYAGLTVSGESSVSALVTFVKPVREVNLRLSGVDNETGVKVQLFDTKGILIEEVTVRGDGSAYQAGIFRYIPKDVRVDVGSFKIVASESAVTMDGLIWREAVHTVDTRNPNIIETDFERFYGTDGNDVVTPGSITGSYFWSVTGGIHGGDGIDTLRYDDWQYLWADGSGLSSIEIIELTARGDTNHGLVLTLSDVLRNGGTDIFYVGDKSRVQMMVKSIYGKGQFALYDYLMGGADVGAYRGDFGDVGDWVAKGQVVIDGVGYNSYQHSRVNAEVLVSVNLKPSLHNRAEYIETWKYGSSKSGVSALEALGDESSILHSGQKSMFSSESNMLNAVTVDKIDSGMVATQYGFSSDIWESHHALYAF